MVGKTVNNIRIYSYKQLESLLKPLRIKVFFFSTTNIDVAIKNQVADKCLAYDIKVMNIPLLDGWMQSHLNSSILKEVKIEELLGRPPIQLCNPEVVNFLSNKNILITGAAGSIGSELARQIAAMNPRSLIICDQLETGLHDLEYELQKKHHLGEKLKFYLGDVKDTFTMEQLFSTCRPEIVFHAAAYKHVPIMENHPSEAIRNNVLGTKVLADLSEKYHVDRFLFVSTDKAINPSNIMGASKRIAEMYCHYKQFNNSDKISFDDPIVYRMSSPEHRTKFIITRFGNVLASNGSVIPRFREQIENGGPVTVTHPEIIRYFMTISEACSLVLEAVTMGMGGQVLLFDMGEPVKILDLAKKMIMLAGYKPGTDIVITYTGLRPGEKLYEELLNKEEEVIPTHNKKILIAKTQQSNTRQMVVDINKLLHLAESCKDEEVVKQMKLILPQYISNNSVYELFDTSHHTDQPAIARM
jgi:FlaA1/EpsC-like NDP-sugar epimerase